MDLRHHCNGKRIVCNAHRRYLGLMTKEEAKRLSFFGIPVSDADIEKSRQRFLENHYMDNGADFNR